MRVYPARPSVQPGERLVLHVATGGPRFRVHFHRWDDGFRHVGSSDWEEGFAPPPGRADVDWNWPGYAFEVPHDWCSGVYIAHLEADGAPRLRVAMTSAAALFVVRGRGSAPLLYKIPLATYHAYNATGGGCFYDRRPRSQDPPGTRVTFLRPGGGIGGETFGAPDFYDGSSPRQTFAHWDAPFIRWLRREGLDVDFCTDLDLHHDTGLPARYPLLVSVGHDEYWTERMRNTVEAFVAAGGNVAFFGANVCWWRIHLVDGATAMVCHQGGPQGARDHWWPATGAARPEDSLTGVSYRHGGGWWDGPRRSEGYVVQDAAHWAFAGTGLRDGDRFGDRSVPPLVGYECDGAPISHVDGATGRAQLAPDAGEHATPPGLRLLAVGLLGPDWQELPHRERHGPGGGVHAAAMAVHRRNGSVFTAGTTDWAQVLGKGDSLVERITRNVIENLMRR